MTGIRACPDSPRQCFRPHVQQASHLAHLGISASTPRIKAAHALADINRARGARVVLGGHHATAMPEEALQHADAVVCGEGATSWRCICEEFLGNPSRVSGIYRDPPPDLSTLPQPRIDLIRIAVMAPPVPRALQLLHQREHLVVLDPAGHLLQQPVMPDVVEETLEVHVYYPVFANLTSSIRLGAVRTGSQFLGHCHEEIRSPCLFNTLERLAVDSDVVREVLERQHSPALA
jgi:hypothetical protein